MTENLKKQIIGYDKKFKKLGLDLINCILLTNIEYLSSLPDGCFKSDKAFGEDVLINDRRAINNRIKFLASKGYINIETINVRGGKKRKLHFNEECLQWYDDTIVDDPQWYDDTIDNSMANDTNIDINIDTSRANTRPSTRPSTGTNTGPIEDPSENNSKVEEIFTSFVGRDSSPISECPSRPNPILNQEYSQEFIDAFNEEKYGMETRILSYLNSKEKNTYLSMKFKQQLEFQMKWANARYIKTGKIFK